MEERVHPIPFRTRKLSASSPMILRIFTWESRPMPRLSLERLLFRSLSSFKALCIVMRLYVSCCRMVLSRGGRVAVPGSGTNFFEGGVFAELLVAWGLFRAGRDIPAGGSGRACGQEPGTTPRVSSCGVLKKNRKSPSGLFRFFFLAQGSFFERESS